MNGAIDLFTLDESEQRALARFLYLQYIPHEGSGWVVHRLLQRLQEHVGPERYREFTAGAWPEGLSA